MKPSDPGDLLPLSTPVFHILLALGQESLHGYGIMQAIESKTGGAATVLPGTLYTTLNRMLDVFPPAQQTQIRSSVAESLRV